MYLYNEDIAWSNSIKNSWQKLTFNHHNNEKLVKARAWRTALYPFLKQSGKLTFKDKLLVCFSKSLGCFSILPNQPNKHFQTQTFPNKTLRYLSKASKVRLQPGHPQKPQNRLYPRIPIKKTHQIQIAWCNMQRLKRNNKRLEKTPQSQKAFGRRKRLDELTLKKNQ